MIKINLLGDQEFSENTYTVKTASYFGGLVVLLLTLSIIYTSGSRKLTQLAQQKDALEKEVLKLKEITKKAKEFEIKKSELASKLIVIATLKKSKMGPVHVLDDLNKAIPERSWLTEVKETGGIMTLAGVALDNQTIAAFMQTLDASSYFNSVDLDETKQDERQGVKVKVFTLKSKVNYTGIETPILASTDTKITEPKKEKKV